MIISSLLGVALGIISATSSIMVRLWEHARVAHRCQHACFLAWADVHAALFAHPGLVPNVRAIGSKHRPNPYYQFYVLDAILTRNWAGLKDALMHLALPALALSTIPLAIVARMTRSSMLEVLRQDYIKTARAKGSAKRRSF